MHRLPYDTRCQRAASARRLLEELHTECGRWLSLASGYANVGGDSAR